MAVRLAIQLPRVQFRCAKRGCNTVLDEIDARDREKVTGDRYCCPTCGTWNEVGIRLTRRPCTK